MKKQLKWNYYYNYREWQYKNIKPLILIEELLVDNCNEVIIEYHFYCFNGGCEFLAIGEKTVLDDTIATNASALYDINFNPLSIFVTKSKSKSMKKPEQLEKMLEIAHILSNEFDHVRVDLLLIKNQIYF